MNILYVILLWFGCWFGNAPVMQSENGVTHLNHQVVNQPHINQILGGKRINPRTVVSLEDTPLKPGQTK